MQDARTKDLRAKRAGHTQGTAAWQHTPPHPTTQHIPNAPAEVSNAAEGNMPEQKYAGERMRCDQLLSLRRGCERSAGCSRAQLTNETRAMTSEETASTNRSAHASQANDADVELSGRMPTWRGSAAGVTGRRPLRTLGQRDSPLPQRSRASDTKPAGGTYAPRVRGGQGGWIHAGSTALFLRAGWDPERIPPLRTPGMSGRTKCACSCARQTRCVMHE